MNDPFHQINDLSMIQLLPDSGCFFGDDGKEKPSLQAVYQYGDKTYIFDNHNHAVYIWAKYLFDSQQTLPVLHIDQHSDLGTPAGRDRTQVPHTTLQDRKHIAYEICDIGNFIVPAIQGGLISECVQLRTETKLIDYPIPQTPYILDIDLDFRAPEMVNEYVDQTLEKTRNLITNASLITIATSPGYIDQEIALKILKQLLE